MSWINSAWGFIKVAAKTIWSYRFEIINAVGAISEWLSSAKELKDAPKYDEKKSTLDETLKMNELLEKQRAGFSKTISDLERDFSNKSEETFTELLKQSEEINEKYGTSIHISALKNQINDYISKMKGSLADKVNQRIQISDLECSSLLKLEGIEREEKIDLYIKKIIKEGKDKYMSELEYELKKTLELFEYAIKEKTEQKEKEIERLLADINNAEINKNIEEKENKKNKLTAKNGDIEEGLLYFKKIELARN